MTIELVIALLRGNNQFPCHLIEGVVKQGLNVKNALNRSVGGEVKSPDVVRKWQVAYQLIDD
jgi:hypothetical protein